MQGANSKNRTIRIIMIKIISHHGELGNVPQSEVTEASEESMAWIILFMYLVKSNIGPYIWYICVTLGLNNSTSSSCVAFRIFKANLFCKTIFLICICSALRAEIAFWESCKTW